MAGEAAGTVSKWRSVAEFAHLSKETSHGLYTLQCIDSDEVFDDIQELAKHTYGGHDFITVMFHKWLAAPTTWLCGVRYESGDSQAEGARQAGIVAFMIVDLLDDGHTGWLEALRVHPTHRKQGLGRWISSLAAWVAEGVPGCKRIRYTTTTHNGASLSIAKGLGMQQSAQWVFTAEKLSPDSSFVAAVTERGSAAASHIGPLTSVEPSGVPEALAGVTASASVVIHDWVARDNTPHTAEEWLQAGLKFFAGSDGSLSWCSSRPVYSGDTLHLCGVVAPSPQSTVAHFAHHLALAQAANAESLWCFSPVDHNAELESWGCSGISGVGDVPQASPVCVMVQREFGVDSTTTSAQPLEEAQGGAV